MEDSKLNTVARVVVRCWHHLTLPPLAGAFSSGGTHLRSANGSDYIFNRAWAFQPVNWGVKNMDKVRTILGMAPQDLLLMVDDLPEKVKGHAYTIRAEPYTVKAMVACRPDCEGKSVSQWAAALVASQEAQQTAAAADCDLDRICAQLVAASAAFVADPRGFAAAAQGTPASAETESE